MRASSTSASSLVSKGVDLLVAAWPLIHRERLARGDRSPRLLLIGFGAYEPGLRALVDALDRGDLDAALEVAARGRGYEGEDEVPLPILSRLPRAIRPRATRMPRAMPPVRS